MVNHEISHESVFQVTEVSRAFKDLIVHRGACWVIDVWLLGCNAGNSCPQLSGDRLAKISWPERANSRPSCRVAGFNSSRSKPARASNAIIEDQEIGEGWHLLLAYRHSQSIFSPPITLGGFGSWGFIFYITGSQTRFRQVKFKIWGLTWVLHPNINVMPAAIQHKSGMLQTKLRLQQWILVTVWDVNL